MSGGPYSRARPWPHDFEMDVGDGNGFQGFMAKPTQDGLMVAHKEESLANVNPTTYSYADQDPRRETTFNFTHLTGGMGEKVQSSGSSNRYRDALGVDCSIGGMPRLGPLFTAQTLPAALANAQDVRQFVVGPGSSSYQLFCLRGQGVYIRSALGVWSLSKDFGAFNYPQQAVLFAGTAGGLRLLVATAHGELWGFDGTNPWAMAPFAAGEAAYFVEVVGHEVFIAGVNDIRVCTDDPLVAGKFGGPTIIGNLSTRITYLKAVSDELIITKEDGIYSTTTEDVGGVATVIDHDLFPELRADPSVANGRNASAGRDALWMAFGDGYYRVTAGGELTPIGPERLVEYDGDMRGKAVSGAWFGDWFHFLAVYNADNGSTFLYKYGTWLNSQESANYQFADVWNGAIADWGLKEVTRLDVIYLDANPTLWIGFSNGTIESALLPSNGPDPANDPLCRYRPSGWLYMPLHTATYPSTTKSFHGATALGQRLNANQTVRFTYRTDPLVAYVDAGTLFTAPGQRVELPDATTGTLLDVGIQLETSNPVLTPELEGIALHEAIRPTLRLEDTVVVQAKNRLVRRDGMVSRRSASSIRALCQAAAAQPGHVRVRIPDGVIGSFSAIDYREALLPSNGRWGLEWDITLALLRFK